MLYNKKCEECGSTTEYVGLLESIRYHNPVNRPHFACTNTECDLNGYIHEAYDYLFKTPVGEFRIPSDAMMVYQN
jgi:hypothetical protein